MSDLTKEEFSMDNPALALQSSQDDLLNNLSLESIVNSQPSKINSDSNDNNQSFKTPSNSISSFGQVKKFPAQGRHSHRIQQYQILGRFEQSQQKTGPNRINCQCDSNLNNSMNSSYVTFVIKHIFHQWLYIPQRYLPQVKGIKI